jgi:hypothetical protein
VFGENRAVAAGSSGPASPQGADGDVVRLLTRLPGRARSSALFVKAKSLLKPYPEDLMDAHDVSPIVNSAKYDGPECIRPISDDEIPSDGQLSLL